MGDWSTASGSITDDVGSVTTSSTGTSVTSGATNTKGSYAQLIASTLREYHGMYLYGIPVNGADYSLDVAIGAAAAERVILADILIGAGTAISRPEFIFLPITIPSGSRVAARCMSNSATSSRILAVKMQLLAVDWLAERKLQRSTTYGFTTATTRGVSIDPGATANTKGAWSQIVASTTNRMSALFVCIGNQANTARTQGTYLLDIGAGTSGSEQVIVPNILIGAGATNVNAMYASWFGPFFCDLPAGTRIAARAMSTVIDATDRLFDVVVYGLD